MRTLVLGGNGFIGSHVVDEVARHGHFVRVFDRHPERHRKPRGEVEYVIGDFGNRMQVSEALETIDVVYLLVGATLPQDSNADPALDVQTNVTRALALLEECVATGVEKVIFISSGGTVYGVPQSLPVSEESPTWPICSYGITRLCVERYLEMFRHLYGLDYTVIRPSNAFGPRQNPNGRQGAISVFLGKILHNHSVTIWGDGSVVRDYVYVEDLAKAIYAASGSASKHRVFNIGSGEGVTLNELVSLIDEQVGSKTEIDYLPTRAFDVPAIYLDVSRATAELGWQPTTSLRDGIGLTLEFLESELTAARAESFGD